MLENFSLNTDFAEFDEERRRRILEEKESLSISEAASRIGISRASFTKRKQIKELTDDLMTRYGDLLTTQTAVYVWGQMLSVNATLALTEDFFFALKHSYCFFDKHGNVIEDEKYLRILERIRKHDPDWEEAFIRHHKMEIERIERVRKGKPFRPSQ